MLPSLYKGIAHLAQGKPAESFRLPSDDIQRTIVGEHMDLLLQPVCGVGFVSLMATNAYNARLRRSGPCKRYPWSAGDRFPRLQATALETTRCEGQGQACRGHQHF